MKKWNGVLAGNFGCDSILCSRNTFSAEGRRGNVDLGVSDISLWEKLQEFGIRSVWAQCWHWRFKIHFRLYIYLWYPKSVQSNQGEPVQANPGTKRGRSQGHHKVLHHTGEPHGTYHHTICPPVCLCPQKGVKGVYKIFNMDGYSVVPTIDSVEQSMKDIFSVERCILSYVVFVPKVLAKLHPFVHWELGTRPDT